MQAHNIPQVDSIKTARAVVNRIRNNRVFISFETEKGKIELTVEPKIARAIALMIEFESQP